jgi:copper transport protein
LKHKVLRSTLAAILIAICGPAFGHAVLLDTSPPDGAMLATSPPLIVLRFNEPVTPVSIRLLDREGRSLVSPEGVHAMGAEIAMHPAALPDGGYAVSYRVISADSHPVAGTFLFTVGAGHQAEIGAAPADDPWYGVGVILRILLYATLLPAAGGVMFLSLVGVRPEAFASIRSGLYLVAWPAGGIAVISLAVKGAQLTAAPTPLDAGAWTVVAGTTFAASIAAALTGLVLMGIGLRHWPNRHLRLLAVVGSVIAAGSFALTGHSATVAPRWLGAILCLGHLLPVAFWTGALWPLIVVLYRTPDDAGDVVRRFSRLAVVAVLVLAISGGLLAAVELQTPAALSGNAYGLTLTAKLALFAGLLLIAVYNKWWLTPQLGKRSNAPRTRLIRAIRGEAVLVAMIFGLTALLSTTSPPHAGHADGPGGMVVRATSGAREALIELRPASSGRNTLAVHLMANGRSLEPLELTLELSLPDAGIEPIRRPLAAVGGGHYVWDGVIPLPGLWHVRLEALINDFEKAVFAAELPVH